MVLLFLQLHEVTGKAAYLEWVRRSAVTTVTPGKYFRIDMSLCHGPPGNGDVLLEAYRVLQDPWYLERAREHAELVRQQGLALPEGIDWWYAGRSYMNGVAGVGHFLLRMHDPERFGQALLAK
jgi:lantibiotic modifying enzyme